MTASRSPRPPAREAAPHPPADEEAPVPDLATDSPRYSGASVESEPSPGRGRRLFDPSSLVPTYIGIGVMALGFALIALAWSKIAHLANVALQLPYLVSAGITGLALVMVGLIVINVAAKRQDAAERARQMEQLTTVLTDLKRSLESPGDP